MHWMTFEYLGGNFHCGRPWHPYGIPYALPDCSLDRGAAGRRRRRSRTSSTSATPRQPHDTSGYPKLTAWGAGNLTYEGTYWRWIERAWLGGLRLMVMSVNENRVLCELQANRKTNCDEMDTVRRGFEDIRELQRYVDAQAGGPGKGFFQIVTDPLRGAARDQPGQDGGRARDRGLRAVRLPRLGAPRRATRRRSTASSTRCTASACARRCCSTSSTTR